MNTFEIRDRMKGIPGFRGVYARDRIPRVTRLPASFIFNTDIATKPGQHWIAVLVTSESVEYFDSTGRRPVITGFLRRVGKPVLYNNHQIQSKDSIACGLFACDFLMRRSRGESFCEILSSFSRIPILNDFLLQD